MKQTAVEWLIEIYLTTGIDRNVHFHQAKEMEKEQIIEAYEQGSEDGYWHPENGYSNKFDSAEQYYNETFKSK